MTNEKFESLISSNQSDNLHSENGKLHKKAYAVSKKSRMERIQESAMLKIQGCSVEMITQTINEMAQEKEWGTVSRWQIYKDIASYFRNEKVDPALLEEMNETQKYIQISMLENEMGILTQMILSSLEMYTDKQGNLLAHTNNKMTNSEIIYAIKVKANIIHKMSQLYGLIGNTLCRKCGRKFRSK